MILLPVMHIEVVHPFVFRTVVCPMFRVSTDEAVTILLARVVAWSKASTIALLTSFILLVRILTVIWKSSTISSKIG
jgi:hypothetical protein